MGGYLLTRLREGVRQYPNLATEAVGRGLMAGVKLRSPLVENACFVPAPTGRIARLVAGAPRPGRAPGSSMTMGSRLAPISPDGLR